MESTHSLGERTSSNGKHTVFSCFKWARTSHEPLDALPTTTSTQNTKYNSLLYTMMYWPSRTRLYTWCGECWPALVWVNWVERARARVCVCFVAIGMFFLSSMMYRCWRTLCARSHASLRRIRTLRRMGSPYVCSSLHSPARAHFSQTQQRWKLNRPIYRYTGCFKVKDQDGISE